MTASLDAMGREPSPPPAPDAVWQRVALDIQASSSGRTPHRRPAARLRLALAAGLTALLLGAGAGWQRQTTGRQTAVPATNLAWLNETRADDASVDDPGGAGMERLWSGLDRMAKQEGKL